MKYICSILLLLNLVFAASCWYDDESGRNSQGLTTCKYEWECYRGNRCEVHMCVDNICHYTPIDHGGPDFDCDHNSCTWRDRCEAGVCVAGGNTCHCETTEDCDDNDACTANACVDGYCGFVVLQDCHSCNRHADCDDANGCTVDRCNEEYECEHDPYACPNGLFCVNEPMGGRMTGVCVGCTEDAHCDDDHPCTHDRCEERSCTREVLPECLPCEDDFGCDDANGCTVDRCTPQNICNYEPFPCSDGLYCESIILPESGTAGICMECLSYADCGDGNPCTLDACTDGFCIYRDIPECDTCRTDHDCVPDDICHTGTCNVQTQICEYAPAACEEENQICIPRPVKNLNVSGCVSCICDSDCDDANACTRDICTPLGECVHTSEHEEGEPVHNNLSCLAYACDPSFGWRLTNACPNSTVCRMDGVCGDVCMEDAECPPDHICRDDTCHPPGGYDGDGDCACLGSAASAVCSGGANLLCTSLTVGDCAEGDPGIGVCGRCAEDSECPPGNICESRVCQPTDGFPGEGGGCITEECTPQETVCADADLVIETDLWVVGHYCYSGMLFASADDMSFLLADGGGYEVTGEILRGRPGECQPNEDFFLQVGEGIGPETQDDADPCAVTRRVEYLGYHRFVSGANKVTMHSVSVCPPDTHQNSVNLKRICLYKRPWPVAEPKQRSFKEVNQNNDVTSLQMRGYASWFVGRSRSLGAGFSHIQIIRKKPKRWTHACIRQQKMKAIHGKARAIPQEW